MMRTCINILRNSDQTDLMVTFLWSRIFGSLYMVGLGRFTAYLNADTMHVRVCPGWHLADNTIFIMIACFLLTYNFSKACGHDGKEIEPCIDYSQGYVCVWNLQSTQYLTPIRSFPEPFECQVSSRSQEAVALIEATRTANEIWGMSCMPVFLRAWIVSLVRYKILELSP